MGVVREIHFVLLSSLCTNAELGKEQEEISTERSR